MLTHIFVLLLAATYTSAAYSDPHCVGNRRAIVQLFEWKWTDIANECLFLNEAGYCAVQTSVATENREVLQPMRPWWERYQPVSYNIASRSGNETEFESMVRTCNSLGIRIYVDVVFNHMAASPGKGVAGTKYDSKTHSYPGVPYTKSDFYDPSLCLNITDHASSDYIKKCMALPLPEIDQSRTHVRSAMAEVLNHFVDLGVAGFRVDSAEQMFLKDLKSIYSMVKDVQWGGRPFFISEFSDAYPSEINISDYFEIGYVTDFGFAEAIGSSLSMGNISGIESIFESPIPTDRALLFVDNHDIQRGRGRKGSIVLTHKEPEKYQQAQALTLASGYGIPRIMSSYYFNDTETGPPHNQHYQILDVTLQSYSTCGNGWVCEHRWPVIRRAVAFSNIVRGQQLKNFLTTHDTISFSRGKLGFFAMKLPMGEPDAKNINFYTGLPEGVYCNMISNCTTYYTIDAKGNTEVNFSMEPTVALVKTGLAGNAFSSELFTPKQSIDAMKLSLFQSEQELFTTEIDITTTGPYSTTEEHYFTTAEEDFTRTDSYSFTNDGDYLVTTDKESVTTHQYVPTTEEDLATTQSYFKTDGQNLKNTEGDFTPDAYNFATTEGDLTTDVYNSATTEKDSVTDEHNFATTEEDFTTDVYNFATTEEDFTTDVYNFATTEEDFTTDVYNFATTEGDFTTDVDNFATTEVNSAITQTDVLSTHSQPNTTEQVKTSSQDFTTRETLLTTDDSVATVTSTTELTVNVTNISQSTIQATVEISTPTPSPWRRTVVLMERQTYPGQDVFIRGGIDFDHMSGCQHFDQGSNPCAVPIRHRPLDMRDPTPARDAWTYGDNYLDWDGTEPRQGTFNNGWIAQGTPGQWTTNDPYRKYFNPLNTFSKSYEDNTTYSNPCVIQGIKIAPGCRYRVDEKPIKSLPWSRRAYKYVSRYGDHYWIVDVDMDCSKTYNGFFEFKAVVNNGWEDSQYLDTQCNGNGATSLPYHSDNHFGRCGFINVYHWNSGDCLMKEFPNGVEGSPVIG